MLYSQTTGTGPDLVLLHGWGFNSELFNELFEKYKGQYRITKIDIPGHGRSDDVAGGLNEWCDEIIKILPKNPILLGWSLGGILAINIAQKVALSKLILISSSPNFTNDKNWSFGIDKNNFTQFSNTLNINLAKGLKRFISLQTKDKTKIKELNQAIKKYPASQKSLNQGLEILLNSDLTSTFLSLNIPIKIILGKYDTLVPNNIQTWYETHGAIVDVLKSGHLPFLDKNFNL